MGLLEQDKKQDDRKPLFRVWAKRQKKAYPKNSNMWEDIITSIVLSSSEEWILIEGRCSVGLISAESKVGISFLEIVEKLDGEMKALKLVPCGGKLGFDIEVDETEICIWSDHESKDGKVNNFFDHGAGGMKESTSLKSLTIEAMTLTPAPLHPSSRKGSMKD